MGIRYDSTGGSRKGGGKKKNDNEIKRYCSCGMIQESLHGPWIPDQQKRGTRTMKIKEGEEVKQKKLKDGGGIVEKKKTAAMFKCNGTLHVIYQRGGNHSFIIQKPHKCTVGQGERGEPDNQIPMVVIKPNINWGISKEKLIEVKQDLVKVGTTQWHNLSKCGTDCQGLCSNTMLEPSRRVRTQSTLTAGSTGTAR